MKLIASKRSGHIGGQEEGRMSDERAREPEDITRLVVERVDAGDADGVAALYEPDAVLAFPPGERTVGREAIRAVYEADRSEHRAQARRALPTLRIGDTAPNRQLARAMKPGARARAA